MATKFKIDIAQEKIDRILARVRDANWPHGPEGNGWDFGANPEYMRQLAAYWVNDFDWRGTEAALNDFPQFKASVAIEGEALDLHFYHVRSGREDARPLILSHGWPGSVFEFLHLIEPLTNPPADEPAFHVVIPSLPGYGFSEDFGRPLGPRRIAAYFGKLMTEVLGYGAFIAQGGDWGGIISSYLGLDCEACSALHINIMAWSAPGVSPETAEEKAHAEKIAPQWSTEGAYFYTQSYRPLSLGFAVQDSPLGWAAWVIEKFHDWSHVENDVRDVYSFDQMITNIMIYLVTDTMASSFWPYRGVFEDPYGTPAEMGARIEKPTAIANLPFEVPLYSFPPRSQVEKSYNIVQWTDFEAGGHFAALEQPEALLADIRKFAEGLT